MIGLCDLVGVGISPHSKKLVGKKKHVKMYLFVLLFLLVKIQVLIKFHQRHDEKKETFLLGTSFDRSKRVFKNV